MAGLYRSIRQLVHEFLSFGKEEAAQLKQQLEIQRAQLQQLKAAREQRRKYEEQFMLLQLRRSIDEMRGAESARHSQEIAVNDALSELESKMMRMMEADMQTKAAEVLSTIDFSQVMDDAALKSEASVPGSATGRIRSKHQNDQISGDAPTPRSCTSKADRSSSRGAWNTQRAGGSAAGMLHEEESNGKPTTTKFPEGRQSNSNDSLSTPDR